jgi:outer membrane lipoprotein-sorting protein
MLSRRYRLAAPFVVSGLIAAGALAPTLRASASPDLPGISAQQLTEKVLDQRVSHLSGTFAWDAHLGLPSLSGLTDGSGQSVSSSSGFDPTSLISGDHTFEVWADGAGLGRIAAPGTLSETDVVRRGNQTWLYDSSTNHVTRYVSASAPSASTVPLESVGVTALAKDVLARIDSIGTDVSVGPAVEVAGRPAYVLRLAPDRAIAANRASTVSSATIAVDAETGLPLRVEITAVGQSEPSLTVGYSSISYATPSASIFTVPKGQTTSTDVLSPAPVRTGTPSAPIRSWAAIANVAWSPSGSLAHELGSVTTVVSGAWGSGRLLTSTLVNALFLDNGRVLVGLVTPAALEAAAGQLSH